jgi:hypothetical protein
MPNWEVPTLTKISDAQASLSVHFAPGDKACVVFEADRGEGPRSGAIPTLTAALLASSLARMGRNAQSEDLLEMVARAAAAFAGMRQPNVLPDGLELVEPDQIQGARAVCTILLPAEGSDFVKSVFASDEPDVAYKAFLYTLQFAVESLPPESLVALSSVLKGVSEHFRSSIQWPDPVTMERELAAGKAGITGH